MIELVRYIVMGITDNPNDYAVVDNYHQKMVAKFIQRDFPNGEEFDAEKEAFDYAEYLNNRD